MLALLLTTVLLSTNAEAQDDYVVGLFTPSLDFADGVARNDFVSKVAEKLSDDTGMSWTGQAYARSSDFESALRKGALDLVIIDGEYHSAKGSKLQAVASLSASGKSSRAMKLVTKRGRFNALHELRGYRLVLPDAGGYAERFVSNEILGGELSAAEFFASVDEAKDVRAAINAVELGNADATLVFEGYESGLQSIESTRSVPLPIIAIASSRIQGELASSVKQGARSITVSGAKIISSASSYNDSAVRDYRTVCNRKRTSLQPELLAPSELSLELGTFSVVSRKESLQPSSRASSFVVPSIEEIQVHPEYR
jgi:hypothetical protein